MRDDNSEILLSRRRMLGLAGAALLTPLIGSKSTFADVPELPKRPGRMIEAQEPYAPLPSKNAKDTEVYLKATYDLDSKHLSNIDKPLADFSNLSLVEADFSNSDLRGANFRHCSLDGAIFDGANLQGAIFDYGGASDGASFKNAKLNGASFFNCMLMASVFDSASLDSTPYEINGKQYWKKTTFDMAWFDTASFHNTTMRGVSVQYAGLRYASFRGAKFNSKEIKPEAEQITTYFKNSDMSYVDLRGVDFKGTPLVGCRLDFAHMQGADLTRMMFVAPGSLWRADLRGANLCNSICLDSIFNMQEANLERADLRDANFKKAAFSDLTRFKGAIYNKKTKWPEGFSPTGKGLILKD